MYSFFWIPVYISIANMFTIIKYTNIKISLSICNFTWKKERDRKFSINSSRVNKLWHCWMLQQLEYLHWYISKSALWPFNCVKFDMYMATIRGNGFRAIHVVNLDGKFYCYLSVVWHCTPTHVCKNQRTLFSNQFMKN